MKLRRMLKVVYTMHLIQSVNEHKQRWSALLGNKTATLTPYRTHEEASTKATQTEATGAEHRVKDTKTNSLSHEGKPKQQSKMIHKARSSADLSPVTQSLGRNNSKPSNYMLTIHRPPHDPVHHYAPYAKPKPYQAYRADLNTHLLACLHLRPGCPCCCSCCLPPVLLLFRFLHKDLSNPELVSWSRLQ